MKSECLSEEFVSANEIKLCHNTEDHNISLWYTSFYVNIHEHILENWPNQSDASYTIAFYLV